MPCMFLDFGKWINESLSMAEVTAECDDCMLKMDIVPRFLRMQTYQLRLEGGLKQH